MSNKIGTWSRDWVEFRQEQLIQQAKELSYDQFSIYVEEHYIDPHRMNELTHHFWIKARNVPSEKAVWFIYHNNLENYSLDEIITLWKLENG
jgi:hypothetical protein